MNDVSPAASLWKYVMEHASWGVAVCGLEGRLTWVNPAFSRMLGRSPDQLRGTPIEDVFAVSQRAEHAGRVAEVLQRGTWRWESDQVRSDGSTFPVVVDGTLARNEQGEAHALVFFVRDITERKRDEYALRALFEQAPDGIFIADGLFGPYIDVNPAGCRMLGYTREELLGKSRADLTLPEELARGEADRERLERGTPVLGEWRLKRADGSWVTVEVNGKLLPDGRWQNFVRDISQRKLVEEALAASEEKFRRIVSVAAEAIILIDEEQRIVLFNEEAERTFGYSAQEMLGRSIGVLLPERYRDSHARLVAQFGTGEASREMSPRRRVSGLRRNGEEFPAQASISSVLVHGERVLAVVLRDITREVATLEREQFMNELGGVLASSLDAEQTLGELTRRVVRYFANLCIVEILHHEGPQRMHVTARDPEQAWLAEALRAYPINTGTPRAQDVVVQTREPQLVAEVTHEYLVQISQGPEHLALLEATKPRSLLSVPMIARGVLSGVLTVISSERSYDQQDQELLLHVAERAAMALENAALHNSLQRAHVEASARLVELQEAHEKIHTLTGLLPVCAWCGHIRDEQQGGTWKRFDQYISERGAAELSHGICPDCAGKHMSRPPPR